MSTPAQAAADKEWDRQYHNALLDIRSAAFRQAMMIAEADGAFSVVSGLAEVIDDLAAAKR